MSDDWEDIAPPQPAASAPAADDGWKDVEKPAPRRMLDRSPDDGLMSSTAKAIGTTAVQGISDYPGILGNLRDMGRVVSDAVVPPVAATVANAVRTPFGYDPITSDDFRHARDRANAMTGDLRDGLPNGDDIARKMALEKAGEYVPETTLGRMAQTAGRAVIGGRLFGAPAKVANAARIVEPARNIIAETMKPGMMAADAGAAASGELVTETTDSPIAGMAAALVTPSAASAAKRLGSYAARPVLESIPGVREYAKGARENMAAEDLYRTASDPEALRKWAESRGPADGVLPEFPLTLGQTTGDIGLLRHEHEMRTADRPMGEAMTELAGRQTAALHDAARGMTPEGSSGLQAADAFTRHYNDIVARYEATEAGLRRRAEESAAAIGERADAGAIGEQLRSAIEANRKKMSDEINTLYGRVNPNGDMRVVIGGLEGGETLKDVASSIHGSKRLSTKFTPGLDEVLDIARNAPDVWDFEELRALDTRLTTEMDQARNGGDMNSYRLLQQLKGSVKETINKAVDNQIGWERANGVRPEDGLEGRLGLDDSGTAAAGDPASDTGAVSAQASVGSAAAGLDQNTGVGASGAGQRGSGDADRLPGLASQENGVRRLYYPGGNSIDARPEIVELRDLNISHGDDFKENPAYPQELQPRNRSVAEAQNQVNRYAGSEWAPERYGPTGDANSGAPVVGPDGVVESGNGRSMALRRRYEQGDTSYRDWLASQGYDVSGFDQPVLVMRRTTDFGSPDARQQYVHLVNRDSGLGLGVLEEAASDAKMLTPEDIYKVREGSLSGTDNSGFISAFLSRLTNSERGRLLDGKGAITQRAIARAQAALTRLAYGDDSILARAFESNDNDAKSITNAMRDAAGPWAKMRQAVRDGVIDPAHDITADLMNGVEKILRARADGVPVSMIMDQIDAFAPPATREIYSLLFDGDKVASQAKITARLNKFATDAAKNENSGFGFGETRSLDEILSGANRVEEPGVEPSKPTQANAPAPEAAPEISAGSRYIDPRSRPNIEPGQAEALAQANAAYGEMKSTMRPAEKMLRKVTGGEPAQRASSIPADVIRRGDQGYQVANEFLRAANNAPQAIEAMREMVLDRFRGAIRDGVAVKAKWETLRRDYDGAIRAIESVSPGFSKLIETAETTADAVTDFARVRKAQTDRLEKSEAAQFLGKETEEEVQNALGGILNARNPSVSQIREMVSTLEQAGGEGAVNGLRKSLVDWIVRKDTNASRSAQDQDNFSYAKLDRLLKDKSHILREILTGDQMNTLQAMRDSMAAANKSTTLTRIPGMSNTASDVKSYISKIGAELAEKSYYAILLDAWVSGSGNFDKAGRAIGVSAAAAIFKLRQMGINTVGDLQREMLLNPEIAREALRRVKPEQVETRGEALARAVRRSLLSEGKEPREERAAGGRLRNGATARPTRRPGKALTPDQIIAGIERARKAEQQRTESILSRPDEVVVRALSAATQHI